VWDLRHVVPGKRVTLNGRMRAAVIMRFGPPVAMEIRAVPAPVPAAGQVLVEVHAAGMNPVDAQNRVDGSWAGITLPAVLGSDAAGTIAALGPGVTGFRVGEPLFYFSDFLASEGGSYDGAGPKPRPGSALLRAAPTCSHSPRERERCAYTNVRRDPARRPL
jgi:hypothetical protein